MPDYAARIRLRNTTCIYCTVQVELHYSSSSCCCSNKNDIVKEYSTQREGALPFPDVRWNVATYSMCSASPLRVYERRMQAVHTFFHVQLIRHTTLFQGAFRRRAREHGTSPRAKLLQVTFTPNNVSQQGQLRWQRFHIGKRVQTARLVHITLCIIFVSWGGKKHPRRKKCILQCSVFWPFFFHFLRINGVSPLSRQGSSNLRRHSRPCTSIPIKESLCVCNANKLPLLPVCFPLPASLPVLYNITTVHVQRTLHIRLLRIRRQVRRY